MQTIFSTKENLLHDLILGQACGFSLHGIHAAGSLILDEGQPKWAATVLVTRELFDRCVSALGSVESDDSCSSRSTVGLVLNFSLLNLSDGSEELD